MAFTYDCYRIFEVDITAVFKIIKQDEFGIKDTGRWHPPETKTTRVVCRREEQAKEYALERYKYSGAKEVSVVSVRVVPLQGIIMEMVQQM